MLTYADVKKEFPNVTSIQLDGRSDFDQVAKLISSRNPKIVWAVINCIRAETKPKSSPKVDRLLALLS